MIEVIKEVPTGHICLLNGSLGKPLEFLSIGDYGKSNNIKADFLGYHDEINGVEHSDLLPLTEKWVITISSQYGCSMNCSFCDVPKVGPGYNASMDDLVYQVAGAMALHPEIDHGRINLHYARMGEPSWNENVVKSAYFLMGTLNAMDFHFHPVVSTMMPKNNKNLEKFLGEWLDFKEFANGDAGLQVSVNTTDEDERERTFSGNAMRLKTISKMFRKLLNGREFVGRKIALNFALTGAEINANRLRQLFDPEFFMCKITPMHMTNACLDNEIETKDGYISYHSYKDVEEDLKDVGYDVLVFVPSKEEDESRITCGNAILSDHVKVTDTEK